MNILFAVHTYAPEANGVQMVTKYMAEGLADAGHTVTVLTDRKGYSARENLSGVEVIRERMSDVDISDDIKHQNYLKVINETAPDLLVVVCTQIWTFDLIKDELDSINCKKILYTHGFSLLNWKLKNVIGSNFVNGRFKRIPSEFKYYLKGQNYYKNLDKIIEKFDVVTYLAREDDSFKWAQTRGLDNSYILPNACEDWFFENANTSYELKDEKAGLTLINVANYEDRKNQLLAAEAFYKSDLTKGRLVLIGRGNKEYYDRLREYTHRHNNSDKQVIALYDIARTETREWYLRSDVMLTTSRWEAFSITLCEGAALGLPIISTSVGNAPEFDGIVLADTVAEIARSISGFVSENKRKEQGMLLHNFALSNCKISSRVAAFEELIKAL